MATPMTDTSESPRRWVWVPCPRMLYKPAYIVSETSVSTTVQSDVLETFKNTEVFKMNPSKFDQVEDLASLSHLNEPSVLHNLQSRYNNSLIYTYSGLFLLALNPYREMSIYSDECKHQAMMLKQREGPPHIYVVANEAYKHMVSNRESQSILITGESGAGKTENTKRVIEFLAYAAGSAGASSSHASVDAALKAANPILEAFGNAKTVKNNNSSRFGKFIQIKFRGGTICGAKIESYLLEKTRVVNAAPNERNFHVFYYLLAGAGGELLETLGLTGDPRAYRCLRNTELTVPGVDDAAEFSSLCAALGTLSIDPHGYFETLAAILLLSNVDLEEREDGPCVVRNIPTLEGVSRLLGIPAATLINNLLNPTIRAGDERVLHYRSLSEARSLLEGLMKLLYDSLFMRLVSAINARLDADGDAYIGILDIAGFEIFQSNSFEQFCINYTNEKLQQYFNHHMFVLEQELYRSEDISWNFIDFGLDLEPTIRAIESVNPIGVLAYLDEECVMSWGKDSTMLDKISKIDLVQRVPFKDSFRIKHYAGEVEYDVSGWLKKNKDVECEGIVIQSVNQVITNNLNNLNNSSNNLNNLNSSSNNFNSLSNNSSNGLSNNSLKKSRSVKKGIFKTVAQAHKENLRNLMQTLRNTQPHFVRCILPNLRRDPAEFNRGMVLEQLRCNGVLEGIRISRLGYPNRLFYDDFVERYRALLRETDGTVYASQQEVCQAIVRELKINQNDYRLGRSRVFFRQGVIADLEEQREKLLHGVVAQIHAVLRERIRARRLNAETEQLEAARRIQKDGRLALALLRWPWWSLLQMIAPLLDVKRSESRKREAEEQIRELSKIVETQAAELAAKTRALDGLGLETRRLSAETEQLEAAVAERDALLAALREENRGAQAAAAELKSATALVEELKEKVELTSLQLANHSEEMARVRGQNEVLVQEHAALAEALETAKVAAEQLSCQNSDLREERDRMVRECTEESTLVEKMVRDLDERNAQLHETQRRLHSQEALAAALTAQLSEAKDGMKSMQHSLEASNAQLERDSAAVHERNEALKDQVQLLDEQVRSLKEQNQLLNEQNEMLTGSQEKMRHELADLQLFSDGLDTKNMQLEAKVREAETRAGRLAQEVEYHRTVNETLKTHLKKEAMAPANTPQAPPAPAAPTGELKKLREQCRILSEEREALYNENMRLAQSKLDDLFNCEAEFSAAKAALRTEIRRLELENVRLTREIEAQQSGSEYSEDFLLENEREKARAATSRLMEMETANIKLQNEVASLSSEIRSLEEMLQDGQNRPVTGRDVQAVEEELESLRQALDTLRNSFQQDFFRLFEERDRDCRAMCEELGLLRRQIAELECYLHRCARAEAQNEELVRELSTVRNDLDAARVAAALAEQQSHEFESHLRRLESAYNERETKLALLRADLQAGSEALADLRALYTAGLAHTATSPPVLSDPSNFEKEMLKRQIETLKGTIAALEKEVADAVTTYTEIRSENVRLASDINSLTDRYDLLKENHIAVVESITPRLINEVCVEKIVNSFVVDKDAMKSLLWKRVVAEKCAACSKRAPLSPVDSKEDEVLRLNNEIKVLELKLLHNSRRNEENQQLIDSMKKCVVRRKYKTAKH